MVRRDRIYCVEYCILIVVRICIFGYQRCYGSLLQRFLLVESYIPALKQEQNVQVDVVWILYYPIMTCLELLGMVLAKGIHEVEAVEAGSRRGRGLDIMIIVQVSQPSSPVPLHAIQNPSTTTNRKTEFLK